MSDKMPKRSKLTKKQWIRLIAAGAMLLTAAVLFGVCVHLSGILSSQKEAERWQGDSESEFSQVSCFLPADGLIGLKEVNSFRIDAMKKVKDASLDVSGEEQLMLDAWSTTAKVNVSSSRARGEAAVIAVGGSYFDFHPIRLISGDYIRQSDLMEDRVLLDEALAWLLFGGTELQGMDMKINGVPFHVAGVIERETDFASKKAYTVGMGLYMRYDALLKLQEDAGINCYEYVLVQPVKDFAINAAREKFPIGRGEILCNTTRFGYGRLMDFVLKYGSRSVQTTGVIYPYWENAARILEDWCCLCCLFGTLLLIYPGVFAAAALVKGFRRGKKRLEEDVLPNAKEKTAEAVRVRRRRHWEKTHPEEMEMEKATIKIPEEEPAKEPDRDTEKDTDNGTE